MIKAVIFDMDGLLIDSETMSYKIYQEILHGFGYTLSKEEYTQGYCGKTEIQNVTNLIQTYDLRWSVQAALDKVLEIEEHYIKQGIDLKSGAKELLCYLKEKGIKTLIATSSLEERAIKILKPHDILPYFDEFVYGNEVEHGKPSPDIFIKACQKINEKPQDCLVLEDSEAGVQAAIAASVPVICIPDMKLPNPQFLKRAVAVVDSLVDVKRYI